MRPVDADLPSHNLVVIQISHGRSGGVSVGKVSKTVSFGLPRLRVHHQAEFGDCSSRAEDVLDLFLSEVCRSLLEEQFQSGMRKGTDCREYSPEKHFCLRDQEA